MKVESFGVSRIGIYLSLKLLVWLQVLSTNLSSISLWKITIFPIMARSFLFSSLKISLALALYYLDTIFHHQFSHLCRDSPLHKYWLCLSTTASSLRPRLLLLPDLVLVYSNTVNLAGWSQRQGNWLLQCQKYKSSTSAQPSPLSLKPC